MIKSFDKYVTDYFIKYTNTDVKVGVSFSDGKECYFLAFKDKDGKYIPLHNPYTCGVGIAMGDLIGPTENLEFIPNQSDIFDVINCEYNRLKDLVKTSSKSPIELVDTILKACDNFVCYKSGNDDRFTNILILPLYAEIINAVLKDGTHCDFKRCDKVLKSIKNSQKKLSVFAFDVMLYENNPYPLKALRSTDILNEIPAFKYSGTTTLVVLDANTICETFIADNYDELISYLVCKYIQDYHFLCCSNCRRYFAYKTDNKSRNCSRYIESASYKSDIGKTCHEVGRLRAHSRNIYSDNTHKIYQRFYKTTFARKMKGKLSEERFNDWSQKARTQRDRCINGEITPDQLLEWFENNNLKE